jgi:hypothetical protein
MTVPRHTTSHLRRIILPILTVVASERTGTKARTTRLRFPLTPAGFAVWDK